LKGNPGCGHSEMYPRSARSAHSHWSAGHSHRPKRLRVTSHLDRASPRSARNLALELNHCPYPPIVKPPAHFCLFIGGSLGFQLAAILPTRQCSPATGRYEAVRRRSTVPMHLELEICFSGESDNDRPVSHGDPRYREELAEDMPT
jgi:hypothetical protein